MAFYIALCISMMFIMAAVLFWQMGAEKAHAARRMTHVPFGMTSAESDTIRFIAASGVMILCSIGSIAVMIGLYVYESSEFAQQKFI